MSEKCELCNVYQDSEQNIIFESTHCYFLMKSQSILIGSGIIIPKKHKMNVFELSKEEWEDTFLLLIKAKEFITKTYNPDGFNVGWNCGSTAGQSIQHAHLHIIPRYKNEKHVGKGIRYWLKQG